MKKRIIYLASLPLFAIGLASCGEAKDYKTKDFTVEMPEKNSSATVEYKTLEEKNGLVEFYANRIDPSKEENKNLEKEFYNKYQSIMATLSFKDMRKNSDGTFHGYCGERKTIIDTKDLNVYYYEHSYYLEDGEITNDASLETNVLKKDGKVTVTSDIQLNNVPFDRKYLEEEGSMVVYRRKATGSLKLTFTFDFKNPEVNWCTDYLYTYTNNAGITHYSYNVPLDSFIAYTNQDKSYLYSIFERKLASQDNTTTVKDVFVKENYLVSYMGTSDESEEPNFYHGLKMEYFENPLLGNSINTDGYTTWNYHYGDLDYEYNLYPLVLMPYSLLDGDFQCINSFLSALSQDEELLSTLTVSDWYKN